MVKHRHFSASSPPFIPFANIVALSVWNASRLIMELWPSGFSSYSTLAVMCVWKSLTLLDASSGVSCFKPNIGSHKVCNCS